MRRISIRWLVLFITPALLAAANIPRPAPELAISFPNGQKLLLSKYRGKVVALEFLLTYCSHCQRASQIINRLCSEEYGKRGVQALGVAINDPTPQQLEEYVRVLGLDYPVGLGSRDGAVSFLQHPPMVSMMMPQLVLIDRKGVIRAQYPGNDKFFQDEEKNLRAVFDSLLKEGSGSRKRAPSSKGAARKTTE